MVYPALLPLLLLMRTPRLPVVDWTDDPADLNGLVRFAGRRNLVSARVPSHFKRSLLLLAVHLCWLWDKCCTYVTFTACVSSRQYNCHLSSVIIYHAAKVGIWFLALHIVAKSALLPAVSPSVRMYHRGS